MAIVVNDKFRTSPLSHQPGGFTIKVEYHDGRIFIYDKVKNPLTYIKLVKKDPNVKSATIIPDGK